MESAGETIPGGSARGEGHDFLDLAGDPASATSRGARICGVSPGQFVNWRWQMRHQLMTAGEMAPFVTADAGLQAGFAETRSAFLAGITPWYAALMRPDDKNCPVRLQALPDASEILPGGMPDPLDEVPHSPVREVVHVYPDRVAFCVAQICPVYCRYCFRKRRSDEEGLHFNRRIIRQGIDYIRSRPSIRDVLITGGDPFLATDSALEHLLQELRAIPHVEIIRFGTRTPVTLPYRITETLCRMIRRYHPVFVNTHFNCAEELVPETARALSHLVDHGIMVGNQAVLLRGVNDHPDKMLALCRGLLRHRVKPYYVFHPHDVDGTGHLKVTVDDGLHIMKSLRGKITGMGIPVYALDTPSGKIPLEHPWILGRDGRDLLLENLHGEIHREKGVL